MKSTQKEEALTRLAAIESEAQELRAIIEEPEQRTPEAGDVWSIPSCAWTYLIGEDLKGTLVNGGIRTDKSFADGWPHSQPEQVYLGKFHEVYVKKSDVRDALSIQDGRDDSFLDYGISGFNTSYDASREALAKLGIK